MMNNKNSHAISRTPDPFDSFAQTRLARMGVIDKSGLINHEAMTVFADVFAGLFYDDICDYYDDTKTLSGIIKSFMELYEKQDYQHMYLLLSLHYDYIEKSLPDPVWWLAGNAAVVREFMDLFIRRIEFIYAEYEEVEI